MTKRVLRRKVIIREYDYKKVASDALNMIDNKYNLYDRAQFIPLNQENLEKLKMLEILKGKNHAPLIGAEWNNNIPAMLLYHLRDYLYNEKYYNWNVTLDDDGYICVQSRKNTPNTRIGWAVFEKDYECRI